QGSYQSDLSRQFLLSRQRTCELPSNRILPNLTVSIDGPVRRLVGRSVQQPSPLVQGFPGLAFLPERLRNGERGDAAGLPPWDLVCRAMQLAMVGTTERHRIFIADLATERAR